MIVHRHEFGDVFNHVFKDNTNGLKLLQVGANDGSQSDPVNGIINQYKIESNLLEPIPVYFNMLRNTYKHSSWVKCHNIAIHPDGGKQEMTWIPPNDALPVWCRGLNTFDTSKNCIKNGMGGYEGKEDHSGEYWYPIIKENEQKIVVNTMKLPDFLKTNSIETIDVFVTDCEGYDWIVFEQLDLDKYDPKLIFLETHTLGDEQNTLLDSKLKKYGYDIIDKGWNTVAIKICQ